jgi:hypothetical protein
MSKRIVPLILSFICCGFGQIYNRQIIKGIDFIAVYGILISSYFWPWPWLRIIGLSLVPLMWVVGMVDAYLGEEAIFRKKQWILGILPGILIAVLAFYVQFVRSPMNPDARNRMYVQNNSERLAKFSVQVAVSKSLDQAERLRDRLLIRGYSARVEEFTSEDGQWFRILVGNLQAEKDAILLAQRMRDREGLPDSIVYENDAKETTP